MLQIGDITLKPLNGGITNMDGGAMFGVVPKPLWVKHYPVNEKNQVPLICYPILIQVNGLNMLIDTGTGNDKVTDKEKRNFGITYESRIEEELKASGLTSDDIDYVLMTHMHFDHALGLTDAEANPVFKNAKIIVSAIEWDEMQHPNIRSKATYWEKNYKGIESQVVTFKDTYEVTEGVTMIHTGGHSNGHAIIEFCSNGEYGVHMGDILPIAAQVNPLWVTAYDDYPMTSIEQKVKYIDKYRNLDAWFTFYHDIKHFAVKFEERKIIKEVLRGEDDV